MSSDALPPKLLSRRARRRALKQQTETDRKVRQDEFDMTRLAVALHRLGAVPLNPEAAAILKRVEGIQ